MLGAKAFNVEIVGHGLKTAYQVVCKGGIWCHRCVESIMNWYFKFKYKYEYDKYLWRAWGIWCRRCGENKAWSVPWTLLLLPEGPARDNWFKRKPLIELARKNQQMSDLKENHQLNWQRHHDNSYDNDNDYGFSPSLWAVWGGSWSHVTMQWHLDDNDNDNDNDIMSTLTMTMMTLMTTVFTKLVSCVRR